MRGIWLLDHGAAGHFAQVQGVSDMLDRAGFDHPRVRVPVAVSMPGWLRGGMRAIGTHAPRALARPLLGAFNAMPDLPDTPPALILGSGGTSAWALRLLGWRTGAATAFIGPWPPFPRGWFTDGLSPDGEGAGEAATGFLVSRMTPERARAAAVERFGSADGTGRRALMVGGRSRSHLFDAADWAALAGSVNARAKADGVRWLIATSPRTGAEAEAILAERLDPDAVAELVLWGRAPDRCAAAFMGGAERVFVTRDSLTMLSEAIASGRPATAVLPRTTRIGAGFFGRMLDRMRDEGWTDEVPCDGLGAGRGAGIAAERFAEREARIVALLAPALSSQPPPR